MKHKLFIAASAAVLPLAAAMCCAERSVKAEAGSAPLYCEGATASGAIVREDDCPVVVEKETLTLNIRDLPRGGELEPKSYVAEAVAEYSFYNPTASDADMTLLFPFGSFPEYAPSGADDGISAVTVDGGQVECGVRYSYSSSRDFDTDRDMDRILDEKKTDGFYREDLPVTGYRLTVKNAADVSALKIKLCYNAKKTRLLFPSEYFARLVVSDGDMYALLSVEGGANEKSALFYAAGEAVGEIVPRAFDGDGEVSADTAFETSVTTFSEFALSCRGENSDVSETDWYNAFTDMLNERSERDGSVDSFFLNAQNLTRWYEYKMTVPAGGRAKNRVRSPLYPALDGRSRYEYTYLLSPAGKWAGFNEIEIRIETPYFLSDSSFEFNKTEKEDGKGFTYLYTRGSLPQGELTFALTEGNVAGGDYGVFGKNFLRPTLTWAFVALISLAAVAAVVTVIVVFSLRKKKKK